MPSTTNLIKVIEEHKEMKRIKDYTEVNRKSQGERKDREPGKQRRRNIGSTCSPEIKAK